MSGSFVTQRFQVNGKMFTRGHSESLTSFIFKYIFFKNNTFNRNILINVEKMIYIKLLKTKTK